jgi:hypothetical protein
MQSLRGDKPSTGITFNAMQDPSEAIYGYASRAVVVAAALSALAPSTLGELWKQDSLTNLVGSRAVLATKPKRGGLTVPDLGLDKTFFGSHRAKPDEPGAR